MKDFVLEHLDRCHKRFPERKESAFNKHSYDCFMYANFLNQPLTLGMFLLCDENNEPLPFFIGKKSGLKMYQVGSVHIERAKKRVLFEGFNKIMVSDGFIILDEYLAINLDIQVDDLNRFCENFVLTESAKKQIGL